MLSVTAFAHAQVVPAARQGSAPLEVGGGMSLWSTNWGPGHMIGITGFADYHPSLPGRLNGLDVEGEYRNVNWNRSLQPKNYKQTTIGAGPMYTVPFREKFRFYGKFLLDYGSMDFTFVSMPNYTHDTRMVYAPGGGVEYRTRSGLWARGDFEYQTWPHLFSNTKSPTPYGFTFGFGYDLKLFRGGE